MASNVDQEQIKEIIGSKLSDGELHKLMSLLGNRSVSIQGNATEAIIATGNNNTINNTINNITNNPINNMIYNINQGTDRNKLLKLIDELEKEQKLPVRCRKRSMLITSVGIGVLLGIMRFLAGLQGLELQALDGLMVTQQRFAQKDNRILVIAPDDHEVQQQGQEVNDKGISLTDDKLAEVLEKIQKYQPTVIGLDLQRPFAAKGKLAAILNPNLVSQPKPRAVEVPKQNAVKQSQPGKRQKFHAMVVPPPSNKLVIQPERTNLIGGCKALETKVGEDGELQAIKGTEIPPPPEIATADPSRIGFVDFAIGVGSRAVMRRQILAQEIPPHADKCKTTVAFSVRVASQLLFKAQGYKTLETKPEAQQCPKFMHSDPQRNFVFPYFNAVTGGFQGGVEENDHYGGCQMLLNYGIKTITTFNLTKLLQDNELDQLNPKPNIILIGSAARTHHDLWLTPLGEMAGVEIQALTISQIIDTVLGKQRLIWVMPEWSEFLWTLSWSIVGGVLGWSFLFWRFLFWRFWLLSLPTAAIALYIGCGLSFWVWQLWLPLVPPIIALLTSGTSVAYLNISCKLGSNNPWQMLRAALRENN